MKTCKPISTISYNSPDFLKMKIDELHRANKIEYAMWIKHEPDEDSKKPHFHVYLKPACTIQTMDFENFFQEIDPLHPDKPLKCMPFRISKESDWVLYGIHDPGYLMEKGLERNTFYSFEDIITTDDDYLNYIIAHLSSERKSRIEYKIIDMVNRGLKWDEIVSSGLVPIRYMSNAKVMYDALSKPKYRKQQQETEQQYIKARYGTEPIK